MLFIDYFESLISIVKEYSQSGLVVGSMFQHDIKEDNIGLIKASIEFIDNTLLYIREYVDTTDFIDKVSYSYHYQKEDGTIIFRYDNALHKPTLNFYYHKHLADNIITESPVPELNQVLDEILMNYIKFIE